MKKDKRFLSRPLEALTWLVAILCVAGIVHLATILVMPRIAPDTAYARVLAIGPLHKVTLLPPVEAASAAS